MRIAILGWGSLVWDPRDLALGTEWRPDGPSLRLEFARLSGGPNANRLTLVLYETGRESPTLWAVAKHIDLQKAKENLAEREGAKPDDIGFVRTDPNNPALPLADRSKLNSIPAGLVNDEMLRRIDAWRSEHGVDAVIWTDRPWNFVGLTPGAAVAWLRTRIATDPTGVAEQYVRRVPAQIRTPVRERIEDELNWWPIRKSPITTADDLRFKEWSECRSTIARLDGTLVDLRKVGFAFITALLTASSFLSLLGQPGQTGVAAPIQARAAAFSAIMVLVAALFALDSYYSVLLSGAVERALDLEVQTDPPVRITKYLSINAQRSLASWVTLILYLVLLLTAWTVGVVAVGGTITPTGEFQWTWNLAAWNPLARDVAWIGVGLAAFMVAYWVFAAIRTGFHARKKTRKWRPGEDPAEKVPEP